MTPTPPSVYFAGCGAGPVNPSGVENTNLCVRVALSSATFQDVVVTFGFAGKAVHDDGLPTTYWDYQLANSITIPAGATGQDVTVTVNDDLLDEDDTETATISLAALSWGTMGVPAQSMISIYDNDSLPVIKFSSPNQVTVIENVGNVQVLIQVVPASGRSLNVNMTFGGTAGNGAPPSDYNQGPAFSIPPYMSTYTLTVPIYDDAIDENNETATMQINTVDFANVGSPSGYTINITDNDPWDCNSIAFFGPLSWDNANKKLTASIQNTGYADYYIDSIRATWGGGKLLNLISFGGVTIFTSVTGVTSGSVINSWDPGVTIAQLTLPEQTLPPTGMTFQVFFSGNTSTPRELKVTFSNGCSYTILEP
jgi:hypothetical protein